MAKVKFKVTDPETGESEEYITDEEKLPAKRKMAAERGVKFEIIDTELSPEEQANVGKMVQEPTTRREAFMGGIMQGVTLGAEDEAGVFGDTETLRRRQQTEKPVEYGAGKMIGGLLPTVAAGGLGALGGAKLGGAVGAAGGPIGAAGGATIGALLGAAGAGTAESYFSKPKESRELTEEDLLMGGLSAVGEGAGRALAPLARAGLRSAAGRVIPSGIAARVGAVEASDIAIKEATERLNAAQKTVRDLATQFKAGRSIRSEMADLASKYGGNVSDEAARAEISRLAEAGLKLSVPQLQQGVAAEAELIAAEAVYNQVARQIPARAGAFGGALGAAVPMAVPEGEMTPSEMMEFDRIAIEKAIEEEKRKKMMQLSAPKPKGREVMSAQEQAALQQYLKSSK